MPLDRFALILVVVVLAAGATIWLAAIVKASAVAPLASVALLPVLPVAYLVWRVISERRANREDDRYDRMDR
ncbi:hypothetical protein [uncultured Jannaschia sp.]|uniref:hypothetical protein n=1 Tax=uncultured Jannaschia sp. TaxID=293347 RepID=UPI002620F111|nr:hypothetical protein [uncultured Jannaschia sp.]